VAERQDIQQQILMTYAYEVITVPNANSFTVTMPSNETGSGMSAQGSVSVNTYVTVGPVFQTPGYGWGTYVLGHSTWGTAIFSYRRNS
jgi:hypothetical protein